jgi:hypothetical protein
MSNSRRLTDQGYFLNTSVTIASGSSDSPAIDARQLLTLGLFRSTGTFTSSRMGFVASRALAGTYKLVYDPDSAGSPLVVAGMNGTTAAAGYFQSPSGAPFAGLYVKLRKLNASTTAVVNQTGGACVIGVVGKG